MYENSIRFESTNIDLKKRIIKFKTSQKIMYVSLEDMKMYENSVKLSEQTFISKKE